jgi:hypothetical protein
VIIDSTDVIAKNQKSISLNFILPTYGLSLEFGMNKEKINHHFFLSYYGYILNTENNLPYKLTDTSMYYRNFKNENYNLELQYGIYKNLKIKHRYIRMNLGLNFLLGNSNFHNKYTDYYHKYLTNNVTNEIEYLDKNNEVTHNSKNIEKYPLIYGYQKLNFLQVGISPSYSFFFNLNNKFIGFQIFYGVNYLIRLKSEIKSDLSNQFHENDNNHFEENTKILLKFGTYF